MYCTAQCSALRVGSVGAYTVNIKKRARKSERDRQRVKEKERAMEGMAAGDDGTS